jgi:hypothetical protein
VSVEFIGMIQQQKVSETYLARGPAIDIDYLRDFAQAHEKAGFDRILVPYQSTSPDAMLTVAYAAGVTQRIHFMLAHRPGFVAPTLAARQLATLDQLSGGRLAVHFISGGSDVEQRRDGDFLSHDERYARTDEYLQILRRVWTESEPFDHEGRYYRFEKAFSEVKPKQAPYVPIYFGGASAPASKSRASTRTSTRSGANRRNRYANRSPAFAPKLQNMGVTCASPYRSGPFSRQRKRPRGNALNIFLMKRGGCVPSRVSVKQRRSRVKARAACWLQRATAYVPTIACGPAWRRRLVAVRIQRHSLALRRK